MAKDKEGAGAFRFTPSKATGDFLVNKGLKPSFHYKDVFGEEHAFSFSVAKAMEMDLLTSIKGALEKAQAEGQTLRQFQKDLTPTLQKLGWWGKKEMTDPLTGESITAQLGSPRRLKTIYNINMRQAYSAAQWQGIEKTKKVLPYLLYETGPSREHRAEHAALAGTVLPVDDAFWKSWMPINGWGCKCRVRQISKREARRRGISPPPQIKTKSFTNRRTGAVEEVPEGLDPGFHHNPGKSRHLALHDALNQRLVSVPTAYSSTALRDIRKNYPESFDQGFAAWVEETLGSRGRNKEVHAVGVLSEKVSRMLKEKGLPFADEQVVISGGGLSHLVEHPKAAKGKTIPLEMVKALPAILEEPDRVLLEKKNDGGYKNIVVTKAIADEDRVARIIIQRDYSIHAADSVDRHVKTQFNTIISASRVDPKDLEDSKRYEEIE